jgi:hypothetical protein
LRPFGQRSFQDELARVVGRKKEALWSLVRTAMVNLIALNDDDSLSERIALPTDFLEYSDVSFVK